ncbi:UPF0287-domain-containing protein [Dichomitus squalens]|uniref:COX assembly mitochondrial protein n=1 Tax=Dichomitus squalens TaxID=114155 RepID=A0A4Q9MXX2_9APHY|nr:UPF0287-domain-containing protein [Dichomitus squalens]TBU42507.1 UPF0287-domain-containing protein [Dichomitus squalens]
MHPQLTEKKLGSHSPAHSRYLTLCLEFIQALDACHADGWSRWTGGCNQAKQDLNMCLRKERVDRTTKNREQAKAKRERIEYAWKELRED